MSVVSAFSGIAGSGTSSGAGKVKFWTVIKQCIQIAAGIDLLFFVLFHVLGSPILAWINVISIALYGSAYLLLQRCRNVLAVVLIWTEVLGHASLGSIMLGWDSGFHYYLLMFITAIFVSTRVRPASLIIVGLAAFYLGLDLYTHSNTPLQPIGPAALLGVRWFNICVVFTMFTYLSYFCFRIASDSQRRLDRPATTDSLTGLFNRRHVIAIANHELTQRIPPGRRCLFWYPMSITSNRSTISTDTKVAMQP